jgi:hypothetical protein
LRNRACALSEALRAQLRLAEQRRPMIPFLESAFEKVKEVDKHVAGMIEKSAPSTGAHQHRDGGPPKLESGYYSSGRMEGFGSNGSRACSGGGGYGGGGSGYSSRSAYDRDERNDYSGSQGGI